MTDAACAARLARTYRHRVTAFRPLPGGGEEPVCEARPCALSRSALVTAPAPPDRAYVLPEAVREDGTVLLAGLVPLLLAGVPMERDGCRRVLHPLDIRTEGEELSFSLELCVPLPRAGGPEETEPGLMKTLHVEL